jgi:hypothetical protein
VKSAARRVLLEVLGWLLIVGGIAALVLPGPGLLMLFGGLAVLSQQYEWAERRLEPVQYRALKGAAEGVETLFRTALSSALALLLIAAGVLWSWNPDAPDWWPLSDSWWLPGGLATGLTQIASGLMALALIVYSYRRFHGKPEAVAALERDIEDADRHAHGS